MRILITGAQGQLGQEFKALSQKSTAAIEFLFTDRSQLNISSLEDIQAYFKINKPDYCINCAAYTAVDKAESDRDQSYQINETAVAYLAHSCQELGIPLIHFSSDYVYHNQLNRPILESDPTTPQSVYAQSKLAGEIKALAIHSNTLIIRTSWVYSSFGKNFVKTMLNLGQERMELRVVADQIGAPTYAKDIAQLVLSIIRDHAPKQLSGVFNFANAGVCSWYDFAKAIFKIAQIDCKVIPISSKEYPTAAQRPYYSVLNTEKIRTGFNVQIPYWEDSLEECLKLLIKY